MEISQDELLAMLATERARAQEEADDRHERELTRLRDDLDRVRQQSSGWVASEDSPGLASQVHMFLDLQSPGTRRTYRSYLLGVLLSVPPCHGRAQLTDSGELVVPSVNPKHQLCETLGCDPDADTHATLAGLTVGEMRDRRDTLELLMAWVGRNAKHKSLAQTRRRRWELRRVDDADVTLADVHVDQSEIDPKTGLSARRSFSTAVRSFFDAQVPEHLDRSPAAKLPMPKKKETNRVAFDYDAGELDLVVRTGVNAVPDPELLQLLCDFYVETGARLNEAFALTMFKADLDDATVTIGQKNDEQQTVPISPTTLAAILDLAKRRGMTPADPWIFRNRRGQRAGKAQMERFWREVKDRLPFAAKMDAATHCFRKTTATMIERSFGVATSEAFLRHAYVPISVHYPRADIRDVAKALAVLTGEPHPLAKKAATRQEVPPSA